MGDGTSQLPAGPPTSCIPPTDGGIEAFYPVIAFLGIAAALGWVLLRALGVVDKNGKGLFDLLKDGNPAVRVPALITVIGLAAAVVIYALVEIAQNAYKWITDAIGCPAEPEMWTPSFVFTVILLGVLAFHRFLHKVPGAFAVSWTLLSLSVGFWLSTWGANIFWTVWAPVALAILPAVLTKLGTEGRAVTRDSGD